MESLPRIMLLIIGLVLAPINSSAQEEPMQIEESAEVFLEEYSDAFQEYFFEALKQKGIENYDKAINLFLECKLLDSNNDVIDFELAKAYLLDNQYISAQEYAIEALLSEPENQWYLNTLVTIMYIQGSSLDQVKANIPFDNTKLRENLALIYFKQKNYERALHVIRDIKKSSFTEELSSKINDSVKKVRLDTQKEERQTVEDIKINPLEELKTRISNLISENDLLTLEQINNEALENYPSQPYFYYAQGYSFNKKAKHREAIEALETALDYTLENVPLLNKIYQELADAHTALNNSSKANMYLRMIKSGF
jgi:uncharacterized protein HemY